MFLKSFYLVCDKRISTSSLDKRIFTKIHSVVVKLL